MEKDKNGEIVLNVGDPLCLSGFALAISEKKTVDGILSDVARLSGPAFSALLRVFPEAPIARKSLILLLQTMVDCRLVDPSPKGADLPTEDMHLADFEFYLSQLMYAEVRCLSLRATA